MTGPIGVVGAGRLRELVARNREARQHPDRREAGHEEGQESERCDLCGEPVPGTHRHLLDLTLRELRCACRACCVLFDHASAGGTQYRLVPDRRLRLRDFSLDDVTWARLRIPVQVAFLVRDSGAERTVVFYPSPQGAVAAPCDEDAWACLERANPVLGRLASDVEALLVDRGGDAWLVPVDDCYALVGLLRTYWKGLTGGPDVREQITQFFANLGERSKTVSATDDRNPA
ncbi:DUF5947 family protein [Nonomuraea sp. NPDC000554]|uniref:DUF5947 family protein n=1 Tax=Nonomuraea sp. NPDC000554 TaxID=3154259 RepID=UPI00331A5107